MEHWEFCRICTKCSKSGQYNKLFEDSKNKLIRQIEEITGILLTNSKKLPQYICKPCEDDLEKAHEFRERCIFAQEYFKTFEYKNELDKAEWQSICPSPNNQLDVKDEMPIEEIENADISDFKEESCDDLFKDGEVETAVVESSNEETMNKFVYDEVEVIDDAEYLIEVKEKATTKPKLKSKRQTPQIKGPKKPSAAGGKRLKAGRKKNNDKNQTFICDQCGNNFTCKHHFITHLRRHTGDKRYQCELCPDKFFTNSELNRHMRKHTGERPFACKHCGRRFTDYSTRIKHERTHTNERPFACTQCTKAFTTSYILKNHMLVHTGERSFRCDLCNRSFQRQTHLVVHARSIMHKQNEEKQKVCNIPATEHNNANFEIIS